jgi:hypothetical protein
VIEVETLNRALNLRLSRVIDSESRYDPSGAVNGRQCHAAGPYAKYTWPRFVRLIHFLGAGWRLDAIGFPRKWQKSGEVHPIVYGIPVEIPN